MWSSWKRFWTIDDLASTGARLVLKPAMEGLRLNGKEVREFCLDHSDAGLTQKARQDILTYQPDVIFLANHPSSVFLHQIGFDKAPCPVLVWLLDDPLLMGNEPFDADEIVLVSDPKFAIGARQRNAKRIRFFPAAAPDRMDAEYKPEYNAPVAYVGSIHVNPQARAGIPLELRNYLNDIIRKKIEAPRSEFAELLEANPLASGKRVQMSGPLHYFLYTEANRIYRLRFLHALAPLNLRLYGNETWKQEIAGTPLEDCFAGRLDPFAEYPSLIRSTAITINLRSLQRFYAPVHRDFLVPRLGGFTISSASYGDCGDWQKADPGDIYHLRTFPWSYECSTPAEMVDAAIRFLRADNMRKEWTANAAAVIHSFHTYSQRMTQLGEQIDLLLSNHVNL